MIAIRSDVERTMTARGEARYRVVVEHPGLHKRQEIKGSDHADVVRKATLKAEQWNQAWARREESERVRTDRRAAAQDKAQKQADAALRTAEAEAAWEGLQRILAATLEVDDSIDWDSLKDRSRFDVPPPRQPAVVPDPPALMVLPEPYPQEARFFEPVGCFGSVLEAFMSSLRDERLARIRARFDQAHAEWSEDRKRRIAQHAQDSQRVAHANEQNRARYKSELDDWKKREVSFGEAQRANNQAIDLLRARYLARDSQAVFDYCSLVLDRSAYPDWCPKTWKLEYRAEARLLVVEYDLPAPTDIPRLKAARYVGSRDAFEESEYPAAQVEKAYDAALYQIALRTVHELFEADQVDALQAVAFNGRVKAVDPATGKDVDACVMTFQASKEEFVAINLAAVDPKACFRKLKGIGSAKLHSLAAVAPVVELTTEDARFVDSYAVRSTLDEGENLAAMDWEDFEHLIRELFELEFARSGGEVKVTRASRDGGVDVVAFDPTPLRGGKIVIQAKRYTNTVGVAAVRELYGTVIQEGAIKGILVTTSHFGSDAYGFAKDKPLELIDGGRLLFLLEQHGHKVRIDLAEAKRMAHEQG